MNVSINFIRFLQIIVSALIPASIFLLKENWVLVISSVVLLGVSNFLLEREAIKKRKSGYPDVSKIITIIMIAFAVFALVLAACKINLFE